MHPYAHPFTRLFTHSHMEVHSLIHIHSPIRPDPPTHAATTRPRTRSCTKLALVAFICSCGFPVAQRTVAALRDKEARCIRVVSIPGATVLRPATVMHRTSRWSGLFEGCFRSDAQPWMFRLRRRQTDTTHFTPITLLLSHLLDGAGPS